jgi:hypothetical protein
MTTFTTEDRKAVVLTPEEEQVKKEEQLKTLHERQGEFYNNIYNEND